MSGDFWQGLSIGVWGALIFDVLTRYFARRYYQRKARRSLRRTR